MTHPTSCLVWLPKTCLLPAHTSDTSYRITSHCDRVWTPEESKSKLPAVSEICRELGKRKRQIPLHVTGGGPLSTCVSHCSSQNQVHTEARSPWGPEITPCHDTSWPDLPLIFQGWARWAKGLHHLCIQAALEVPSQHSSMRSHVGLQRAEMGQKKNTKLGLPSFPEA